MTMVAYARTSTADQEGSLQTQIERFKALGVDPDLIFAEKRSGGTMDRPKLMECLRTLRKGDTFVCTKADRIARSATDLLNIVEGLEKKGVGFQALDQPELSTNTPAGKFLRTILAGVAEFERDLIRSRQAEGIQRALAKGVKFGRDPKLTSEVVDLIRSRRKDGRMIREIMGETGLSKATVYRALGEAENSV